MRRQLELAGESAKTQKAMDQVVIITYPVNVLVKCLSDGKAFGHVTTHHTHPELMEDLLQLLNQNILPDIQDYQGGSLKTTKEGL